MVEMPAGMRFDKGVWFRITQGINGVLVLDEDGSPVVYRLKKWRGDNHFEADHFNLPFGKNAKIRTFAGMVLGRIARLQHCFQ